MVMRLNTAQNTQTDRLWLSSASEVRGMTGRSGKVLGRGPSSAPYLGRYLLVAGLVFSPSLRVVEGRLGLGVSACGRWVVVVVGVLGTQVELCKARGHTGRLAEGLGARDHERRRRRRRGGGAVATF